MSAHWGIEDPAAIEGPGQREAFERALHYLSNRISLFLALPHDSIDEMAMERKLKAIGRPEGPTSEAESADSPPPSSSTTTPRAARRETRSRCYAPPHPSPLRPDERRAGPERDDTCRSREAASP